MTMGSLSLPEISAVSFLLVPGGIGMLIDAAVRSLLAAMAVWVTLHLFRTRNVLMQKAAWILVLTGALMMPLLAPWAAHIAWIPSEATLVLHGQGWLDRLAANAEGSRRFSEPASLGNVSLTRSDDRRAASSVISLADPAAKTRGPSTSSGTLHGDRYPAPSISNSPVTGTLVADQPIAAPKRLYLSLSDLVWLVYGAVSTALLLRLLYGLGASIELWLTAEPVEIASWPGFAAGLRLRSSRKVSSPVTVGSGIVLPAAYDEWDQEKMRIVLAHERSHVRQGDFYLQALAELYTALFWFSPLGWWIKRKLSDLSEAISDRAGLKEARSHTSYAQILLEFAAIPRLGQIGVAMAHTSRLSHRIERLLNETSFRQAFAGGRRRMIAALLLVSATLFGATALIRVDAAQSVQQPSSAAEPIAGQAHPEDASDTAPEIAPVPAKAPVPGVVGHAPALPSTPSAPKAPPAPPAPAEASEDAVAPEPPDSADAPQEPAPPAPGHFHSRTSRSGRSYYSSDDSSSYALVTGEGFSGDWNGGDGAAINKARAMAHGDFLWFSRNGKSYVVDDPQTIARIKAMYKPMEDLGRQQEELGRQQEELGRQQEELGRKQEQASIPTPDVTREMADLNAAMAKLQTKKGGTVTEEQLAELESKLGELQDKLGSLQGLIGDQQGELGAQQGKLGELQGKLGDQQGRLGEEQGRIAHEADTKVKSIIDQSLKDGKAKPVQ